MGRIQVGPHSRTEARETGPVMNAMLWMIGMVVVGTVIVALLDEGDDK